MTLNEEFSSELEADTNQGRFGQAPVTRFRKWSEFAKTSIFIPKELIPAAKALDIAEAYYKVRAHTWSRRRLMLLLVDYRIDGVSRLHETISSRMSLLWQSRDVCCETWTALCQPETYIECRIA
jgi:hypothetical protein